METNDFLPHQERGEINNTGYCIRVIEHAYDKSDQDGDNFSTAIMGAGSCPGLWNADIYKEESGVFISGKQTKCF